MANIKGMSSTYAWLTQHKQLLVQQLHNKRLPHALLIHGEAGAGKGTLANWLATRLACLNSNSDNLANDLSAHINHQASNKAVIESCGFCKHCKLIASQSFPDLLTIDEGDKAISVDAIRAVTRFLETRPQIATQKVVVIKQVELLTVAAANALLKTLEEPTLGNILVLTTNNTESLLPTILSRCQLVSLRPLLAEQFGQEGALQPYANTTYLPELQQIEQQQAYEAFAAATIGFLTLDTPYQVFEQALLGNDRALIWLERIISTLMRVSHQWQAPHSPQINWQAASKVNRNTLMRIFQVILSANKRSLDYQQSNQEQLVQQLALTIKEIVSEKERVNG
ncbi:DNA polymerase III subunit [Thalassotalea euphylliae]|uniref:DNA polymerase III subunit n=1 Tax=Thalassotalea euphylliae TaxID=1655234 RepID=UPI0015F29758|nr:DNA polymerase III subunit [Thalassotalea euphylliae]